MHNYLCNNQTGNGYSFEYLEAVSVDMFARISSAARDPTTAVILPGATASVIPLKFIPQTWAAAFLAGFHAIVSQLDNPIYYQTWLLRRQGQAPSAYPTHKPSRTATPTASSAPTGHTGPTGPRAATPARAKAPKPGSPAAGKAVRTCFISFLRQYKINLKATNALPAKCEATCRRIHYKDLKSELTKAQVLDIARATTLVSEENRAFLITAISADTKFK
ncbi:hypothetical protein B484DRAFT_397583 [Ochromonadaceae sp. CCMP2298]|nr:hypothetical protein B484DRAFT_397583 [Ochromonadaceae sp. CCMP2298]